MEQIISFAKDIIGVVNKTIADSEKPEYLPHHMLMLFQRFKKAYEDIDMEELADTISNDFCGYIYREFPSKQALIQGVKDDLNQIKFGCRPFLQIVLYHIAVNTPDEFIAIVKVNVSIKIFNIPTGFKFNSERLVCHARPEGKYHYWRITKFEIYKP